MRPDDQVTFTVPADRAELYRRLLTLPTPILQWYTDVALPLLQAQHPGEEPPIEDLLRLLLPTLPAALHPYVRPEYRHYLHQCEVE